MVDTLYLGGGTPSRLGRDGLIALLDVLRARLDLSSRAEVTVEVNPDDVDVDAMRAWKSAGVNRVSIGAQSFDDVALRWMHRTHDAAATLRAVEAVLAAGLADFSLDLIFALPEALGRSWERDIEHALAVRPSHISLYGLTVEPRSPLGRRRDRGEVREASEERYEQEYLIAHQKLGAAGFEHYEVSSFARPGRRARHNAAYWQNVPYAGLGPGAHEFDGSVRRWNAREYATWLERLSAGTDPAEGSEILDDANLAAESVYLGLRTSEGLRLSQAELTRTAAWREAGWGYLADSDRLALTAMGWLRLDSLAADLTLVRSCS